MLPAKLSAGTWQSCREGPWGGSVAVQQNSERSVCTRMEHRQWFPILLGVHPPRAWHCFLFASDKRVPKPLLWVFLKETV